MVYVHLVVFLSLVEYLVFVGLVGAARNKYDVPAPAMSGNADFERILRVH